jgi:hypothetical protein
MLPGFPVDVSAFANFMRLPLMKAALVAVTSAAKQEIRVRSGPTARPTARRGGRGGIGGITIHLEGGGRRSFGDLVRQFAFLVGRSHFGYTVREVNYASNFASRVSDSWLKGP